MLKHSFIKNHILMLTDTEKKIMASIQGDMPVTERPYLAIAEKLNISEETLLETLRDLCDRGVIRRFGATLRHQKSGFSANAMVAWHVDEARADEVGEIMASFKAVSHCYRRRADEAWPYNLYTMIHARDRASCHDIARRISEKTSVKTFMLLFSRREFKKTSMTYFSSD